MTRKPNKGWWLILLCSLAPLTTPAASAGERGAARAPSTPGVASLSDRVDALAARLGEVEAEVAQLKGEKQAVQEDLDRQQQEAAALKSELGRRAASSASRRPSESEAAVDRPRLVGPASHWGTRLGYQGFPFGQKEGGFSYGFFFDHRLLAQSEGIPFGDLNAEISLGVARSGTDRVVVNSIVEGQEVDVEFRQTTLSLLPSLKYYLNRWAPLGVRPYVIGGPGIWADVIESPPLFVGQAPAAAEFTLRKVPVDGGANVFEGGQGGAGLDLSLARTGVPILERLNLGFDYRYSAWTAGQRFSTYSFSLSASD